MIRESLLSHRSSVYLARPAACRRRPRDPCSALHPCTHFMASPFTCCASAYYAGWISAISTDYGSQGSFCIIMPQKATALFSP